VLLHGDAHPSNSLLTSSGEVALIDWDSSGPGPAVIDLGFLAVSCDTGLINRAPVPADPARLAAMLAGYRAEFTLTAADLAALEAAVAFRVLVGAAVGIGAVIGRGREPLDDPGVRWSLDRFGAVPELADRIRSHLT
jgi:Ser/Thr protein kinase RdoA (MazF antagonist)